MTVEQNLPPWSLLCHLHFSNNPTQPFQDQYHPLKPHTSQHRNHGSSILRRRQLQDVRCPTSALTVAATTQLTSPPHPGTAPLSRSRTSSTSSTTPRSTPTPRSSSPRPPSTSSSPASTPARASRSPRRTSSTSPTAPSPARSPSSSSRTPTSPGPSWATASAASSCRRATRSSPTRPRLPSTAASA